MQTGRGIHFRLFPHGRHGVKVGLTADISRLLVTRSLDFLTNHALAEGRAAPKEEFVVVGPRVGALGDAAKAVEVELTLKTGEFGLAKVAGVEVCE